MPDDEGTTSSSLGRPEAPSGGDALDGEARISAPGAGDGIDPITAESAVVSRSADDPPNPPSEPEAPSASPRLIREVDIGGVHVDPAAEDQYWSEAYSASPNLSPGWDYQTFRPACRYGWESFQRYHGQTFDELEPILRKEWEQQRGASSLDWDKAKPATRAAWNRVERAQSGRFKKR